MYTDDLTPNYDIASAPRYFHVIIRWMENKGCMINECILTAIFQFHLKTTHQILLQNGRQRPINIFTLLDFFPLWLYQAQIKILHNAGTLSPSFKHVCEISIKYLYHAGSEWAFPLQRFIWPPPQMNALHLAMRKEIPQPFQSCTPSCV